MSDPNPIVPQSTRRAGELFETAYAWDIANDRLEWQPNAVEVLGVGTLASISTGQRFDALVAPDHRASRLSAIVDARAAADDTHGVAYRVQFKFVPDGRHPGNSVWLEDTGRWWPASGDQPARARGILRLIDERYIEDQRLIVSLHDDESAGELQRTRLFEALGAVMRRAERTGRSCALLLVSITGLEALNTRFGLDIGDEIIAAAGRLLKASLGEQDSIARYASNTFAVIVDDCPEAALAERAGRMIGEIGRATFQTSVGPLAAAISIGAVTLPGQAPTVGDAIANALAALENAKQHPGTFVAHCPEAAIARAQNRAQSITGSVIAALEENRLLLALQPVVHAASSQPAFYEALLRLKQPDGTLLAAADFIEEAETLGLARPLDRRALELALDLLAAHPALKLSLNISSLTAGDKDWLATLEAASARHPGLTERLTVEITETAMIHDVDEIASFVDLLRASGCKVAIDDFGAGYTSFRHLKSLHVDMLKIDGMFMSNLPNDHQARVLVKTMIEIAQAFGLETVAEWVSDEETAIFLRSVGITYLQGFLHGSPITVDEMKRRGLL